MVNEAKVQESALAKVGEVAVRGTENFLLIWHHRRRRDLYEGIIGGNQFFWTKVELTNGEVVERQSEFYTVRVANPIGNGFYYVECQHRSNA